VRRGIARPQRRCGKTALLGLLACLGATTGSAALHETVELTGFDGISVSAEYYRPERPSSSGAVFIPGAQGNPGQWRSLADSLASSGWHVLVAPVADGGRTVPEGPRWSRGAPSAQSELWRDILAAQKSLTGAAGESLRTVVLGGAGLGATAAAIAASREPEPPAALLLLSPEAELAGVPVAPVLVAMGRPCLLVSGRDDALSGDAARAIYLGATDLCRLWECDGALRGEQLLVRDPWLVGDLVEWARGLQRASAPRGEGLGAP